MTIRMARTGDERFFMASAIVMALVIAAGFSVQLAMGRSTFRSPPMLHVHAVVFFGWTVLYVVQNALAATGRRLHRVLGWIGAVWATVLVLIGAYTLRGMARSGSIPFFFEPAQLVALDGLTLLGFAGLVIAGFAMRRRTGWHRRLMFCAMALLTAPGIGRLLPMPLFMPWCVPALQAIVMLFPLAGIEADRRRGRVHPAWWWGLAVVTMVGVLTVPVSRSPAGEAAYRWMVAGSKTALPPYGYPRLPHV